MKIAQICPSYDPYVGGIQTFVHEVSKRLDENGFDVEVLTTDPSHELPTQEKIDNVCVKRFSSWAPNQAYYISESLRNYLRKKSINYDIIHAHDYHAFPALYAAYAKNKNSLIFSPTYFGKGYTVIRSLLHYLYHVFGKTIFEKADAIVCASKYEYQIIMENFKIRSEKIFIIPNGVSLQDFRNLHKKSGQRTILYVGRLVAQKGVQYLIKALPYLDEDITLDIVGSGSYHKNLIGLAKKLMVDNRINFHGNLPRKELPRKYSEAGLFVSLSKYESYGITIAEALAARTPCIVANAQALSEWIDNTNCFGIDYTINVHELVDLIKSNIGNITEEIVLPDLNDITNGLIKIYSSV